MLSETQQDFEFMAYRRGLNLDKRNSAYEDGKTAELWDWWQTAQSTEPRQLMLEWDYRLVNSKEWVNCLPFFLRAVEKVIDTEYEDNEWEEQFKFNEDSPGVIFSINKSNKKLILATIQNVDELIGVEWLVCGVREENHKKIRGKVRKTLENLHERCKYGYLLETLSRKKASNAAVRISTHGLCFTNQVIELARKYKEEDS